MVYKLFGNSVYWYFNIIKLKEKTKNKKKEKITLNRHGKMKAKYTVYVLFL